MQRIVCRQQDSIAYVTVYLGSERSLARISIMKTLIGCLEMSPQEQNTLEEGRYWHSMTEIPSTKITETLRAFCGLQVYRLV